MLGLSRVLGGSLRNQQTAHLITDCELNNLVRDLLRTLPQAEALPIDDRSRMPSVAQRSQLRVANAAHPASGFRAVHPGEDTEIYAAELDLEPLHIQSEIADCGDTPAGGNAHTQLHLK